jgi:hypothetical protein
MAADRVAAVAEWLAGQDATLMPLVALGPLVRSLPGGSRRDVVRGVLAALGELDAAGLVRFVHLFPMPLVGVLDADGLRRVARSGADPPVTVTTTQQAVTTTATAQTALPAEHIEESP